MKIMNNCKFIIGDLHFGRHDNSLFYLNISTEMFKNFIIKNIKEYSDNNGIDKTEVIFEGDIFDDKQLISIIVNNKVIDLFVELSKYCHKIYILVGNHDVPTFKDLSINANKSLSLISNVEVIYGEKIIDDGIFLTSWCYNKEKLKEKILLAEENKCKHFIGHNSVSGFFYEGIKVDEKTSVDIEDFGNFESVHMGHIHSYQKNKNICFTGTPNQVRQLEYKNKFNGMIFYDFKLNKETLIPNEISPKYKRISFFDICNMNIDEANLLFENSFLIIVIPNYLYSTVDLSKFKKILKCITLEFKESYSKNKSIEEFDSKSEIPLDSLILNTDLKISYRNYIEQLKTAIIDKQEIQINDFTKNKLVEKFENVNDELELKIKNEENNDI
jgi:DNA repair exonuclease SbcCD nuclease subunit